MKILDKAYGWMVQKANTKNAIWWLALVSTLEGFISPIPPDPMLAVIVAVKHSKAVLIALFCTLASVMGGIIGYLLGALLYDSVGQWILDLYGYSNSPEQISNLNRIAFVAIALKALTPIPYKIIAIIAGLMCVDFIVFVSASCISRFIRFFIVSIICNKYGGLFLEIFAKNKLLICIIIIVAIIIGFVLIAYI